jgi:hypothetical protein
MTRQALIEQILRQVYHAGALSIDRERATEGLGGHCAGQYAGLRPVPLQASLRGLCRSRR